MRNFRIPSVPEKDRSSVPGAFGRKIAALRGIAGIAFALLFALAGGAFAHELVAKPSAFEAAKGERVTIGIHSTHKFIVADEMDQISALKAGVFRGGKLHELKLTENAAARRIDAAVTIEDAGESTLVLVSRAGVWSKTNQGGKSGTRGELEKKGLKVSDATKYEKYVKVILNASKNDKNFATVTGQGLEIIPVTNPADAAVGRFFEVRVLVNGRPYSGGILATYDGFVTEYEETYAYSTICENGTAFIKITAPGAWGVRAVQAGLPGVKGEYDSVTAKSFLIFNVK